MKLPLVLLLTLALAAVSVGQDRADWANAEKKFQEFAKTRLKDVEAKPGELPASRFVEYRSQRLAETFPEHRFFALDSAFDGKSCLYALHATGKIEDLGNCTWTGDVASKTYQVPAVLDFVRKAKLAVKNADDAIAAAQLVEDVQGAPNYAAFLRVNTQNYTVLDRRFIEAHYGPPKHWKWSAAKRDGGWLVTREYVGPPASIQAPPKYELDVNDDQQMTDLRRRNELPE
jgi:hypothetical protein